MTEMQSENRMEKVDDEVLPVALLVCADLMFAVQLQNIARSEGYRPITLRPGDPIRSDAAVLIVNLSDLGRTTAWQEPVESASAQGIPVVAFGPHIDSESRRAAKVAGASRVLANSNLSRDLPDILEELHHSRAQREL